MWTIMLCFLLLTSPMSLHRSACQTYSIYSSSWSPACRREKLSETEWGVRVETECGWDNMEPHGTQILLSLPCANLSGETKVAMLGQSLYIKSCKPGQLTLVWEMGGDKRGGSWECVCWVTEGKRKGKCVCVCEGLSCRKIGKACLSVQVLQCLCNISLWFHMMTNWTPGGKVCAIALKGYARKCQACGLHE